MHNLISSSMRPKPPNILTGLSSVEPAASTSKAYIDEKMAKYNFKTPSPVSSKTKKVVGYNISDVVELEDYLKVRVGSEKASSVMECVMEHKNEDFGSCLENIIQIIGNDANCLSVIKKAWKRNSFQKVG